LPLEQNLSDPKNTITIVALICPQKVVQLNVSLRHDCLPSRKRPAELVWVAQTGAAA